MIVFVTTYESGQFLTDNQVEQLSCAGWVLDTDENGYPRVMFDCDNPDDAIVSWKKTIDPFEGKADEIVEFYYIQPLADERKGCNSRRDQPNARRMYANKKITYEGWSRPKCH